jgi:hypothetical protein
MINENRVVPRKDTLAPTRCCPSSVRAVRIEGVQFAPPSSEDSMGNFRKVVQHLSMTLRLTTCVRCCVGFPPACRSRTRITLAQSLQWLDNMPWRPSATPFAND